MQLLVFIIAYPLLWAISKLPFPIFYFFSDCIYILVYRVIGYRKKVVQYNLKTAFPEKSNEELKQIEKKFYHHMCDLFLEMIKSLSISEKEMTKRFTYTNIELLKEYDNQNKSVMLILGHYASYEWIMSTAYHLKNPGYGVYMPIANKYFDKLVQRIRTRHKAFLLNKFHAAKEMVKHRRDGVAATYGFVSDQSPQKQKAKYWRKFFGVEVPVFVGAEQLAKGLNMPVVFVDIHKLKRGYYECTFKLITDTPKAFDDYRITDIFTKMLEEQIKKEPAYYLWTHKRFKHRRN